MTDRLRLSPSVLSMLSKCGLQAYYRYVEGRKMAPGIALIVGTAAHRSHELNLKNKATAGVLLPRQQIAQIAADTFDQRVSEEGFILDDDDAALGEERALGQGKDQAVAMAGVCATAFAPKIEVTSPDDLERKVVLEAPEFGFDLSGKLDIYERRRRTVRDTKTAAKRPSPDDLASDPQTSFYAFALSKEYPDAPPLRVARDVAVKTKTPQAHTMEAPAPTDFGPLLNRIERAGHVFKTGAFYPVDSSGPSAWVCSAKWCGFFSFCPFGKRARVAVSMSQVL